MSGSAALVPKTYISILFLQILLLLLLEIGLISSGRRQRSPPNTADPPTFGGDAHWLGIMTSFFSRAYGTATSPDYVERLCSSWLLPPLAFAALRAFVAVYAFTVLFTIIGYELARGEVQTVRESFDYFTVLGYWGLACYYAVAAAHTLTYAIRGRPLLARFPRPLKYLQSVFYCTVTVYPIIVTAVFWGVLSKGAFDTQFSTWSNISEHALNTFLAVLEMVLPRSQPHPWLNLAVIIVILACYLGLAYLCYATEHFYVYSFLNPANGGRGVVAGYCIGILVATVVVFVIVHFLIRLRMWIVETKLGLNGKLSNSGKDLSTPEVETKQVIMETKTHR